MVDKKSLQTKDTIEELLFDPRVQKAIQLVIPRHLTPEKLLRVAVTVIRRNYMLMQCTKQSLLSSLMGAAALGLELEPFLGQAYLVPYKNKKGYIEAQLIPGYRGYLTLARRTGQIQSASAQVVYEKDKFEVQYGIDEKLIHIPADGNRGNPKGAYFILKYKDGGYSFDYMSVDDINKIMNRTKSKDEKGNIVGPWLTDWAEMAKKTVIRRHIKLAPISTEMSQAAELEERALIGESQIDLLPAPEEAIEVESKPSGEPAVSFDELAKQKAKEGKNIARLNDFLSAIAEANKATVDQVKIEAAKDWEEFWITYEKWLETADAGKETPQVGEKKKRGRPSTKEKASEATAAKVNCPNTGEEVETSACETCPNREGCPALGD